LLWDLHYAELFFTDVYWPNFSAKHLSQAIDSYKSRDRRFGGGSGDVLQLHMVKSDLA